MLKAIKISIYLVPITARENYFHISLKNNFPKKIPTPNTFVHKNLRYTRKHILLAIIHFIQTQTKQKSVFSLHNIISTHTRARLRKQLRDSNFPLLIRSLGRENRENKIVRKNMRDPLSSTFHASDKRITMFTPGAVCNTSRSAK